MNGIKHQVLSGVMSPKVRDENLQNWRQDPECQVLLFTSVGATGLNMTDACNVIHNVSTWDLLFHLEQTI